VNRTISSILIANRGEIAVRIIRACRELGIRPIAVYSDADRSSPHVLLSDEAYHIGPSPSSQSYLDQQKLIDIALKIGVDAIHPGYGFLSENAGFAGRVTEHGLIFIGPPAASIEKMGSKTTARKIMEKAGVPIVPGSVESLINAAEIKREAQAIGYPVLLKAAGGGGGKGMRVVEDEIELPGAFKAAQNEARSAFNDDRVYIEKFIRSPKHIEIQILGDEYGNYVHLGERECSIQRRHQKIIEEAPSIAIDEKIRNKMGEAAIKAAKACDYVNAGTIEFLLDEENNFYFLEMNTRIQVEHPVTELITGVDIVKEQIRIASGRPLSFHQDDVRVNGHAIECRIYAEDPLNNFLPSIGKIKRLQSPSGPGIREDRGIQQGNEITVFYDPMVSKLLAWGRTREEALQRMDRALNEYLVQGIITNIPACIHIIRHPLFLNGTYTTGFMTQDFNPEDLRKPVEDELLAVAISAATLQHRKKSQTILSLKQPDSRSRWKYQERKNDII
jgi:acetyl-CoA carboxylase, biotin carboxylase subunit